MRTYSGECGGQGAMVHPLRLVHEALLVARWYENAARVRVILKRRRVLRGGRPHAAIKLGE